MKLAEALSERARLQTKISELNQRIKDSALIQEGDKPAEEIQALFDELSANFSSLESYIYRINNTNINAVVDGESITKMLSRRDAMMCKVKTLQDILSHCSTSNNRYSRNEIKFICTIDIAKLRKELDENAKKLRELDLKIQSLNWTIDLL